MGGGAGASAGLRDTPRTRKGIGTWTRSIFHTPGPRLTGEAWTRSTIRHDAAQKKTPGQHSCCPEVRRTAATYSPNWCVSTIGADELNGSVRDGKRWILIALTTAICYLRDYNSRLHSFSIHFARKDFGLLVRVGFAVTGFTPPAYRRRSLQRPLTKSHLGDGFALRCFQRLS